MVYSQMLSTKPRAQEPPSSGRSNRSKNLTAISASWSEWRPLGARRPTVCSHSANEEDAARREGAVRRNGRARKIEREFRECARNGGSRPQGPHAMQRPVQKHCNRTPRFAAEPSIGRARAETVCAPGIATTRASPEQPTSDRRRSEHPRYGSADFAEVKTKWQGSDDFAQ